MNIKQRQQKQTGLVEPNHHPVVLEPKYIKPSFDRAISICIYCGYIWEKETIIQNYCPACKHKFLSFPPIRK